MAKRFPLRILRLKEKQEEILRTATTSLASLWCNTGHTAPYCKKERRGRATAALFVAARRCFLVTPSEFHISK